MVISKGILRLCFSIIILITALPTSAQNIKDDISTAFEEYQKVPASNIYLHLNKSVLVRGEHLGFTAYVFDHKKQIPSYDVKNLYCQIIDSNSVVVKEKLLMVENGLATDVFVIDSDFSKGNYSIRAYTNWMKNFEDPQYFESPIKILSSAKESEKEFVKPSLLDIQILPESGHLLEGVLNRVGVSIKTDIGKGLSGAQVSLLENGLKVSKFSLDKNGHGRFSMIPIKNNIYSLEVDNSGKKEIKFLPIIEQQGIIMSVNQLQNNLLVELLTNEKTIDGFKDEKFILVVNGSSKASLYEIKVSNLKTTISIPLKELQSGVNQITLLTKDREVICQRLTFNYNNFEQIRSKDLSMTRQLDTIEAVIKIDHPDVENLSVSILPIESLALDDNLSILSKFKLEPYVRGPIENPRSYFQEINSQSKYQMDNLLLCQGWTMYDWEDIFKNGKNFKYKFEIGLNVKANVNSPDDKQFMVFPTSNTPLSLINSNGQDHFMIDPFLAFEDEVLRIAAIDQDGETFKPKLYLQFTPSVIPSFDRTTNYAPIYIDNEQIQNIIWDPFLGSDDTFDAVLILADKEKERRKRIKNQVKDRVHFFNDSDRMQNFDIVQYLKKRNITASRVDGNIEILTSRALTLGTPLIVINERAFSDPNILTGFDMSTIDYVEFDFSGFSEYKGNARAGVIRIVTNPLLSPYSRNQPTFTTYEAPLTFSRPTKFYQPIYQNYTDSFFKQLGVIDWQGSLSVTNGQAQFKMPYFENDEMLLHIQGWTSTGQLIDELQTVKMSTK